MIAAFGCELAPMQAAACMAARELAMRRVPAAATVGKPRGLIVYAAECRDGFPGHGSHRELLHRHPEPREVLRAIGQSEHVTPDQSQVQIQPTSRITRAS